jgi:hypothetical protein
MKHNRHTSILTSTTTTPTTTTTTTTTTILLLIPQRRAFTGDEHAAMWARDVLSASITADSWDGGEELHSSPEDRPPFSFESKLMSDL